MFPVSGCDYEYHSRLSWGSYDFTNVLNVSFVSKFLYDVILGAALFCFVKHRFTGRKAMLCVC